MAYEVQRSRSLYSGHVVDVRVDDVLMPGGETHAREVVEHADSVAVVARDADGHVLLIKQYRHPVGGELTELPAGLLDASDDGPLAAARRELREETGVTAQRWTSMLEVHTSPGILTEKCTIFLAEQLSNGTRDPDPGSEEETLHAEWVTLHDAIESIRDGAITDALAICGLLAVDRLGNG